MSDTPARRIALFIDFENLVTNTGITPESFDLQPPLDRLLEKGKVIFRRAYCDWSRFREAKKHLHDHGVELIEVPPSTRAGKNSADMRLVIDALELCYAREHIDTFVIASGDSDFVPLASKLRENDKYVIGLGVKQSTSPVFVKACDEFIYLRTPERRAPAEKRDEKREKPDKGDKAERPARVVMVTECSMSDNVAAETEGVEFVRGCNICPHMKRITLENILWSLHTMSEEVFVPPEIAGPAARALGRMPELSGIG